jgi:hypothetical protein
VLEQQRADLGDESASRDATPRLTFESSAPIVQVSARL